MPVVGAGITGRLCRESSSSTCSAQPCAQGIARDDITDDSRRQRLQSEERVPLLDGRHAPDRPQDSLSSSNSVVVSPSIRALAALQGTPMSVSPQRVEAEVARRTSSIPRSRRASPSNGLGSLKRATYPSGTAKTADLIEAFPQPSAQQVRSRNSAPASMSIFPTNTVATEHCKTVAESSDNRLEHVVTPCSSEHSIIRMVDGTRSPSASNVWVSGALPNPAVDGSADTANCISRSIRGEAGRYRHSGTPVHDIGTASLRDMDEADDSAMAATLSHPGSPATGKTGATRFFSAASHMVVMPEYPVSPTSAPAASILEAQNRDEYRVQQERAVANGALRFVSHAPSTVANHEAAISARRETVVPVTMTSHGRACSHKRTRLRSKRPSVYGHDGTQEGGDGGIEQSKQSRYCLMCQAKGLVRRISRLLSGGRKDTRSGLVAGRKSKVSS